MSKSLPYTSLRDGDPVIFLNHADRWVKAGVITDSTVRWQCGEGSKPVVKVLMHFETTDGRRVEWELDVRKLKVDPDSLDGIIRNIYR